VYAQKKNYLLNSAEILNIMEKSQIVYQPSFLKEPEEFEFPEYKVIGDQFFVSTEGKSLYLYAFKLSEEGLKTLNLGEDAFKKEDYSSARQCYENILSTDKDYYKAFTYIGDTYYVQEKYDSAKYFFKLAIEKNFIDYSAHWFLADTYSKLGENDSALQQITIAHLLNRNHKNMMTKLKKYRRLNDKDWNEWELNPISKTYKKDDAVIIETTEDWLGYACAEAVWKYEPDLVKNILGKPYTDSTFLIEKEAAGIYANLNSKNMEKVKEIFEEGYFQEMIWYEMLSRKYPAAALLVPKEFFERILEYINKYH
jgi:tetratricopeptide (TPR) repeat protein